MKLFITIDYEIFFGKPTDDIHEYLIKPTNRFIQLLNTYNIKCVVFVDAGYLFALKRQKNIFKQLSIAYNDIVTQLQSIELMGHEIGFHIHPHWEDCYFDGIKWQMNLTRYKIADYTKQQAENIFKKYYSNLQSILTHQIVSYRAGGWCLEPFQHIKDIMKQCGLYIDSTVYPNGYSKNVTHQFNFKQYPKKELWRFNNNPKNENADGYFYEIPFTTYFTPPSLYWSVLKNTIVNRFKKNNSGEGVAPNFKAILKKLFTKTLQPVSIDTLKCIWLLQTFKQHEKKQSQIFCMIGHPKCFGDDTYKNLLALIMYAKPKHSFSTFFNAFPKPIPDEKQSSIIY